MVAVERDVISQNINFARVDRRGGGEINREGAFVRINTVHIFYSHYCQNINLI